MLEHWTGPEGDAYEVRNRPTARQTLSRRRLFDELLDSLTSPPASLLEVGAGAGQNISVLRSLNSKFKLGAVEPNDQARSRIKDADHVYDGQASCLPIKDNSYDVVFTSGLLIHIPPNQLHEVCSEIYRVAKSHILCIEYFSPKPEHVIYQGRDDLLWKRDFGQFWVDEFEVKPLHCGFAWKGLTYLDNLTYWSFEK